MDSKDNKRMCSTIDYNHELYDVDDSFGDIFNILDFPDGVEGDGLADDWASQLGPIPSEVFREMLPPVGGVGGGSADMFGGVKLEPYEPKYQPVLKTEPFKSQPKPQPPIFLQEKTLLRIPKSFEAPSPDSVLQSRSSSTSSEKTNTISFGTQISIPVRTRTKRAKSNSKSTVNPWSRSLLQLPLQAIKIKKKRNYYQQQQQPGDEIKKCSHCQITTTPQWREGPKGPKTLCNACGVRYRSGRLFPEYRPAASPTFVPSLHSNSHRKVIEMRQKGGAGGGQNRVSL